MLQLYSMQHNQPMAHNSSLSQAARLLFKVYFINLIHLEYLWIALSHHVVSYLQCCEICRGRCFLGGVGDIQVQRNAYTLKKLKYGFH